MYEVICFSLGGCSGPQFTHQVSVMRYLDFKPFHVPLCGSHLRERLSARDTKGIKRARKVGSVTLLSLTSFFLVCQRYLAATAEVMQKHYPERQSRILVVNAPWWFAGIWKTVSGMLASGTQAKLQIRGANFLPTLLEHVDASQVIVSPPR